jgi:hypothetical protein
MSFESTNVYCQVHKCRFPKYHITSGHKCGKCGNYGHGLTECGDLAKIAILTSTTDYILPKEMYCKFGGCETSKHHTSESHHCELCNERFHSKETCIHNEHNIKKQEMIQVNCPICKQTNQINKNQQKVFGSSDNCVICLTNNVEIFFPNCGHVCVCSGCYHSLTHKDKNNLDDIRDEFILKQQNYDVDAIKMELKDYPSYTVVYEGQGCLTYVRRLNKDTSIEGLFVHCDDGYLENKMKTLDEFIKGYCFQENVKGLFHEWQG